MSIENPERQRPASPLASRVERGATSAEIAAVLAALCQEITAALSPIVGLRGVAALHHRSHHLLAAQHDGVADFKDAAKAHEDGQDWVALLAERDPAQAMSAGEFYLQTFHDLLTSLIGPSLTERLLRAVWPPVSSAPPGQEFPR